MKLISYITAVLVLFMALQSAIAEDEKVENEQGLEDVYLKVIEGIGEIQEDKPNRLSDEEIEAYLPIKEIYNYSVRMICYNNKYVNTVSLDRFHEEMPKTKAWQKMSEAQKELFAFQKDGKYVPGGKQYLFGKMNPRVIRGNSINIQGINYIMANSMKDAYYMVLGINEIIEEYRTVKINELNKESQKAKTEISDAEEEQNKINEEIEELGKTLERYKYTFSDTESAKEELKEWNNRLSLTEIDQNELRTKLGAIGDEIKVLESKKDILLERARELKNKISAYAKENNSDNHELLAIFEDTIKQRNKFTDIIANLTERQIDVRIELAAIENRLQGICYKLEDVRRYLRAKDKELDAWNRWNENDNLISDRKNKITLNNGELSEYTKIISENKNFTRKNISISISPVEWKDGRQDNRRR